MLIAQYTQRGPQPEALIDAVEVAQPALEAGQVLLEVLAAPINPSDVLTVTGEYGVLPPLPAVGGNEGVGRVAAHGPGVSSPAIGSVVFLPIGCGTWSSHVVAEAGKLFPLPESADPEQLAMLMINPPTAALMLSEFVDLAPTDWVIQNAANSGVGTYLIQLAKLRGFRSVNIVRRDSAVEGVRAAGGDVVLVDGDDLAKRVAQATDGAAISLGIDAVGGTASGRLSACLAPGSTLVNYGAMSGEPCSITPLDLIFRDIQVRGFWLARWFREASVQTQQAIFTELTQYVASGKLAAKVAARFDLRDIKLAVKAAAGGERDGKILVIPKQ